MSNPTATGPKRIPYGVADYGRLRRENAYYVDKTHYIPLVEAAPFYLFCIRPRRFGKSLWLSVLQHYYDVNQADNFALLFGDTYIRSTSSLMNMTTLPIPSSPLTASKPIMT